MNATRYSGLYPPGIVDYVPGIVYRLPGTMDTLPFTVYPVGLESLPVKG